MKARLTAPVEGKQFLLQLTPENPAEVAVLKQLASSRTKQFLHRGYQYMSQEVEFLIQESSSER